ncbi:hypothetical protein [Pseudonocardia nigra]|uniref:hypothetical protein n=1 Tax=Pseudonocardia nigra TaxID=1921578 RepID=UPI001C5F2BBA|nr:hypothetical protein [Pseudonocardia nigra]
MTVFAVLTIVGVAVVLAAVAAYLIAYLVVLRSAMRTLGTVNAGVRAIGRRVEPLGPVLAEVNGDLAAVRDRLGTIVGGA